VATFLRPIDHVGDGSRVLLGYLDYFRSTAAEKVSALSDDDQRRSILPSGWTPVELVKHLVYMERRWLVWGFLGEPVDRPWGDNGEDDRWRVGPEETTESLLAALQAAGGRTPSIVEAGLLSDVARSGGRFTSDAEAPQLERILLHVLQEYARHCGHLDVVVELMAGPVGE